MLKRKGLEYVLVFVLMVSAALVVGSQIFASGIGASENPADKTVIIGQKIPFTNRDKPVSGLTVSGSGRFPLNYDKVSRASLFRVILTDQNNRDYLMYDLDALTYRKSSFFSTYGTFKFKDQGFETAYLDNVYPKEIRIEQTAGVEVRVEGINPAEDSSRILSLGDSLGITIEADTDDPQQKANQKAAIRQLQAANKQTADQDKIAKINFELKKEGKKWIAGETSVSRMTYQQKKDLYGGQVPNLQGLDYYIGGTFEFGQTNHWPAQDRAAADQNFPDSWDWRNRHGENWVTPVKDQGTCGGCWAFSSVASIEASLNTTYNRHLDDDLSEQWTLCIDSGGCEGGFAEDAYQYLSESGKDKNLPKDSVLPYKSKDDRTPGVCPSPLVYATGGVKVEDWEYYRTSFGDSITESQIKKAVIEKGPISFSIDNFEASQYAHAMLLVGWKTDTDGAPIWIIKNSYGVNWGEKGYLESKVLSAEAILAIGWVTNPYYTNKDMTSKCDDKDKDGYYNWGIGARGDSCPSTARAEKDCNDSNPALGPFDAKYNCAPITPPPSAVAPTPSPAPTSQNFSFSPTSASVNRGQNATVAIGGGSGSFRADLPSPPGIADIVLNGSTLQIRGLIGGNTSVRVTDNQTGQSLTLQISVAANQTSQATQDPCNSGYLNLSKYTIFITDDNPVEVKVCGGTPPLQRPFRAKFKKRNILVEWKDANTLEIKGVRLGVAAILVSDSKDPNNYKMIRVAILRANPTAAELEETTPSLVRSSQNAAGSLGSSGSTAATDCGTAKSSDYSSSYYNYYYGYSGVNENSYEPDAATKCFMAKVGTCQGAKVIYDDSYSSSYSSYSSTQKYELELISNGSSCKIRYKVIEDKSSSSYSNTVSNTEGKEMTCDLRNNDYDVQSRVKTNDLKYFAEDVYGYLYDKGRNCSGSLVDWHNQRYSNYSSNW